MPLISIGNAIKRIAQEIRERTVQNMRIITGSARGAVLATLEGDATRPTPSKVKEAIFSAIQFDLEGRRFLDLFAGSGQMGLEALSRGAEKAVMVDSSREALEVMKANAQKTHLYAKTSILCMDFQQYIRSARGKIQFDIAFLDPPYALRLIPQAACALYDAGLLTENAILICEDNEAGLAGHTEMAARFRKIKEGRYGRIFVTYLAPLTDRPASMQT